MNTVKVPKIIRYNLEDIANDNELDVDESAIVFTSGVMTYIVKTMLDLSINDLNRITPVSFQKAIRNDNDLNELLLQCITLPAWYTNLPPN